MRDGVPTWPPLPSKVEVAVGEALSLPCRSSCETHAQRAALFLLERLRDLPLDLLFPRPCLRQTHAPSTQDLLKQGRKLGPKGQRVGVLAVQQRTRSDNTNLVEKRAVIQRTSERRLARLSNHSTNCASLSRVPPASARASPAFAATDVLVLHPRHEQKWIYSLYQERCTQLYVY